MTDAKPKRAPTKTTRHGKGAGHGGPASGMPKAGGWGGPAKGKGAAPFTSGDAVQVQGAHSHAKAIADREEVLALYTRVIRNDDEPSVTRMMAGDRLLDRIEGKAQQRHNISLNTDPATMTDAELAAIAARATSDADPE